MPIIRAYFGYVFNNTGKVFNKFQLLDLCVKLQSPLHTNGPRCYLSTWKWVHGLTFPPIKYDWDQVLATTWKQLEHANTEGREARWYSHIEYLFGKKVWQSLIKLNVHLPYDTTIPLLSTYPSEIKIYGLTKAKLETTKMSLIWWMDKLWHIHIL